jgi:hypothetical protein
MKNITISVAAVLATLVLASCGYKSKIAQQEKELKSLKAEKKSVDAQLAEREAAVSDMITAFDEIERNLVEIKAQENIITAEAAAGIERDRKAEIITDIKALHTLLQDSRAKVDALDKKLAGTNWQLTVFQKKIDELKVQLDARDADLVALRDVLTAKDAEIARLFTRVDTLTVNVAVQEAVIKQQDKDLHTAYYTTGTFKELRDGGVITTEGGVLGIGKTHDVTGHVAADHFERIDIREVTVIPVNAKKAVVLSEHPSGSYRLVEKGDYVSVLEITDPGKFWKPSRYLVIEVKGQQQEYASR